MRRSHRLAPIGLCLIAVALPTDAGAKMPPLLLPLADGNHWRLRDVVGGTTATVAVARGQSGLLLQGLPGAGDLRVRAAGRAVEAWDPSNARWEPFLRLGAAAGTTYLVDLGRTALWRSLIVRVASRQAIVHDARGKTLRGCVRLTFAARKPIADAGLEELVFAPGIGLVRTSEQTIAGTRVRVLASYRTGP
jgi:hypothetical protein